MSSLIQMRRALYEQKMQDDYPGCYFACIGNQNAPVEMAYAVTPKLEIPSNCTSISYAHYTKSSNFARTIVYNGNSVTNSYTPNNSDTRSVSFTAGTYSQIQMCFNLDKIDDCYIKDNTNNTYLWKGKNVT